jgi:hypothetical protein
LATIGWTRKIRKAPQNIATEKRSTSSGLLHGLVDGLVDELVDELVDVLVDGLLDEGLPVDASSIGFLLDPAVLRSGFRVYYTRICLPTD